MLGFYDIDKNYIKYLKSVDRQVPDIEYTSNNKFVCGVVLEINEVKYYAPISHMTNKQQTNLQIIDKGKPISTIRFSFMIPALDDVLIKKDFKEIAKENRPYADLLYSEYIFCSKNKELIKQKAESVYKIGCNPEHKLNYTCCNFKRLEENYKKYKG